MIRKLIIKRTMSPILQTSSTSGKTLLRRHGNDNQATIEKQPKYLDRDRPISAMEHRQADIQIVPERKVSDSTAIESGSLTRKCISDDASS